MESIALSVIIAATLGATVFYLRRSGRRFRLPRAMLAVAGVTTVVSVVGNLNPDVLALLARDRTHLLAGEWWRLITPLLVQDGGWPGLIFNIVSLLGIGLCAESLHRSSTFLIVYGAAGVISEVAAYTVMPDQGFAGNSVANMGAAALCLVTLCAARTMPASIIAVVGLLAGAALIVTWNLHGVGFLMGTIAGVVLALAGRLRRPARV